MCRARTLEEVCLKIGEKQFVIWRTGLPMKVVVTRLKAHNACHLRAYCSLTQVQTPIHATV